MRALQAIVALALLMGSSGCVAAYGARLPTPGLLIPPAEAGDGEVAIDLAVGRNIADGIDVRSDGSLGGLASTAPIWPGADLSLRLGLADGLGVEARLASSILLPLPVPIPNGFSVAPVFRLAKLGPSLRLHVMPRVALVRAELHTSIGPTTDYETNGAGLDVPVMLEWTASSWFTGNVTGWARGFRLTGRRDEYVGGQPVTGEEASWYALGFGVAGNAILQYGPLRVGLQVGLELGPNPGAFYCLDCTSVPALAVVPQGALSLGGAW